MPLIRSGLASSKEANLDASSFVSESSSSCDGLVESLLVELNIGEGGNDGLTLLEDERVGGIDGRDATKTLLPTTARDFEIADRIIREVIIKPISLHNRKAGPSLQSK